MTSADGYMSPISMACVPLARKAMYQRLTYPETSSRPEIQYGLRVIQRCRTKSAVQRERKDMMCHVQALLLHLVIR